MTGLLVRRAISFSILSPSSSRSTLLAGFPFSRCSLSALRNSASFARDLSPFMALATLSILRSTISISEKMSSRFIVSISRAGSTLPSTWIMSSFSKQRTTWIIASTSRMWERNLLPSPSPFEAPLTRPAMSTNSIVAGVIFTGWYISTRASILSSGTATTPTFGSMVQNG